jgi:hypothetical protein
MAAKGWHASATTMFLLMTPIGVGSCFGGLTGQCTTNTFCAYHSGFYNASNEPVLYANEPYDAKIPGGGCSDGTSPNGDDADAELNTISHEHIETITDPGEMPG